MKYKRMAFIFSTTVCLISLPAIFSGNVKSDEYDYVIFMALAGAILVTYFLTKYLDRNNKE